MELKVLNSAFQIVDTIDAFESLIWRDAYIGAGDFELVAAPGTGILDKVSDFPYLFLAESDHIMMVEEISINSDSTSTDKVTVKGRSVEGILDQRIVESETTITGNLQNGIKSLLDSSVLIPTNTARKIDQILFEASNNSAITALSMNSPYYGEIIYTIILTLCTTNNIGFGLFLNESGKLVFKLYAGLDRSYAQNANPYVIFSPENDNLLKSNYSVKKSGLKTVTKVIGKGDGNESVTSIVMVQAGAGSGLGRKEMFTDASSITKKESTGTKTDAEYIADSDDRANAYVDQIKQKGTEDLAANIVVETFEAELNPAGQLYDFNVHYFMGDIVQVEDAYGHAARYQVTEAIHSQDDDGPKFYPKFTKLS